VSRKSAKAQPQPTAESAEEIAVEPGLGFKAFLIEDGRLQINQQNDNVVLSKTEFKVLSAQFAPWRDAPSS
jgi:hypothetical protein